MTGAIEVGVVLGAVLAAAAKAVLQLRRGVRPLVLAGPERWMAAVVVAWGAAVVAHGLGLFPSLFGARLFDSAALRALGAALMLAGLGFAVAGMWTLGRSWRVGIDPEAREELVARGVYAISRNPIFLFFHLVAAGVLLTSASPFFLVAGVLVMAATHWQVLREERYLEAVHGGAYAAYRGRVYRYLGRRRG